MKIREVNAAMLTDMRELWNETSKARPDHLRDEDLLRHLMMEDGGDAQDACGPMEKNGYA